jgi:hypothetical protein
VSFQVLCRPCEHCIGSCRRPDPKNGVHKNFVPAETSRTVIASQMPQNDSPAALQIGETVRYFSSNLKCWVSATVESIKADGTANLINRRVDASRDIRAMESRVLATGRQSPNSSECSIVNELELETEILSSDGIVEHEEVVQPLQKIQKRTRVEKSRYSSGGLPIKSLEPTTSSRYSSPGLPIKSLDFSQ